MGQVPLGAGSAGRVGVLLDEQGVSVISDRTLTHQTVVVAANGVLHDSGEGEGLVDAATMLLNGGDQFQRVVAQADAELLRGVGMVLCHWMGTWLVDSGGGDHQDQRHDKRGIRPGALPLVRSE